MLQLGHGRGLHHGAERRNKSQSVQGETVWIDSTDHTGANIRQ